MKSRTVEFGSVSMPAVVNTDSIWLSSASYRTRFRSVGSAKCEAWLLHLRIVQLQTRLIQRRAELGLGDDARAERVKVFEELAQPQPRAEDVSLEPSDERVNRDLRRRMHCERAKHLGAAREAQVRHGAGYSRVTARGSRAHAPRCLLWRAAARVCRRLGAPPMSPQKAETGMSMVHRNDAALGRPARANKLYNSRNPFAPKSRSTRK